MHSRFAIETMKKTQFTRVAAAAAAAAALSLVAPATASAGGPTSVLLVSPGRHATASLYTTDEGYGRLLRLLGENPVAEPGAPDAQAGPGSDAINVTWLVHDVSVWRVDRIDLETQGGPWISTASSFDGPALDKSIVHRASDAKELVALLSALKLLGESPPTAYDGPKVPAGQAAVNQPVRTVAAQPPADRGWLWLLLGVAAGAVLVVGFRPLVRRLRPQLASGHE
jgi:hypothetical protein